MQWGEKTHTHTHTKVTVFNSAQCHTLVSLTSSLTKEFGPNTNQSPSITTWREKFAGQKWVAVNIWTLCHKVFTICSHRMKGVGEGEGGRDWLGRTHMSRSRTSREYHKAIQAASAEFRGRLLPQAPEWHWFEIFEMFIPPDVFHRSLFHLCDILGLFYIQVLFFFFLSLSISPEDLSEDACFMIFLCPGHHYHHARIFHSEVGETCLLKGPASACCLERYGAWNWPLWKSALSTQPS